MVDGQNINSSGAMSLNDATANVVLMRFVAACY
jgi:hypothetical protein